MTFLASCLVDSSLLKTIFACLDSILVTALLLLVLRFIFQQRIPNGTIV